MKYELEKNHALFLELDYNHLLPAAFYRASMKLPSRLMRRRAAVGRGCKESRASTAVWTPPAGSGPRSARPAAPPATLSSLCCCYHSPQLGLNICKEGIHDLFTVFTITPYFSDGYLVLSLSGTFIWLKVHSLCLCLHVTWLGLNPD